MTRLQARRSVILIPEGEIDFSLFHSVRTGSGAYTPSYSVGAVMLPGSDVDPSSPFSVKDKNEWSDSSATSVYLLALYRDIFIFTV
jgi:hypothetical protein